MIRYAFLLFSTLAVAGEFTTSLNDATAHTISAITTDSAGNTYVVGSRQFGGPYAIAVLNGDFAISSPVLSLGGSDIFLTKLDPNGKVLFTDSFAGKGNDAGLAIALDPSGNIYIAGNTTSDDFPLSKALQTKSNSAGTGFVMKLSNDGTTILYSTYFGGTLGQSSVTALATDSKGNLYLTGTTLSADFPHTTGLPAGNYANTFTGIFMSSISAAGDKILYSGTVSSGPIPIAGGTLSPFAAGVDVDSAGKAYYARNVVGGNHILSFNGFILKVNSNGNALVTFTIPYISAIAVDAAGNSYAAGFLRPGNQTSVYVSKLDSNGNSAWTNNFNTLADTANAIAVDASGNAWITGTTSSGTFPNQGWSTGPEFLAELNAIGKMTYSALYPAGTVNQSVALDPSGLVHVAGYNGFVSALNPNSAPTTKIFYLQNYFGGAATARISPAEVISIFGPGIGPATPQPQGTINGFFPTTVQGVQVTINGMDMPIVSASPNQINAVVPMAIAPNTPAVMRVINGTAISPDYPVWIAPSAPQALATVVNQDGSINSETNPAKANSVVTFYATGWQSNFSPLADGQIATTPLNICAGICTVTAFGTSNDSVQYAGAAPGIVAGVTAINVRIGPSIVVGQTELFVSNGSATILQNLWVEP